MQYDLEWWNWPDDVIPHRFRQELDKLADVSTIHVRINSNGGSVFGAYAIMNLLKSHKAQVITYNDGIAASAATLIAMAGNKVVSGLGSIWMIHLPSTQVFGNSAELQKAIGILDTITDSMLDVYHAKTGIAKDELRIMLNEDTWMTGTQAKEKGFVDEITDLEVVAYLGEDKQTAFFNGLPVELAKIRNKEKFVAMLPAKPQSNSANTANPISRQNEKEARPVMILSDLRANHPEIYAAAVQEGVTQATSTEALAQVRTEGVMLNFQEQAAKDLDAVFFNAPAMEFVEQRKIKGVKGVASVEHICNIVVDRERYMEQRVSAKSENVTLNGLLFFIKTAEWREKFKRLPAVNDKVFFAGKRYRIDSVVDDMGMLEITLEIPIGGGPHG